MSAHKSEKKSEKIIFAVEKREVMGKKLKTLREQGLAPANIFGKDFASTAITVNAHEFLKLFRKAGETQVLYLHLGKDEIPVMVAHVQRHPVDGNPLHIDFKKVDLKKKIEAEVPIMLIGEAEAVAQKIGEIHQLLDTLTVEALPSDMPQSIEIDVTHLKEVDQAITVADVKAEAGYSFIQEPETMIVKIAEHKEESTETELPEGEAPAAEGEAPSEGGEAPAEGGDSEAKSEE
jgi:large subunit ribosomal protein L25